MVQKYAYSVFNANKFSERPVSFSKTVAKGRDKTQ